MRLGVDHFEKIEHLQFPTVGWGYMPLNKDVLNIYDWCQERFRPKKVLEIGFHVGHSTTYQLEYYKSCKLLSISPPIDGNAHDRIPDGMRGEQAMKMEKHYKGRFKWLPGTTEQLTERLQTFGQFDFGLIDGSHKEIHINRDMWTFCNILKIPYFLVDNWEQRQINILQRFYPVKVMKVFHYYDNFKNKERTNHVGLLKLLT